MTTLDFVANLKLNIQANNTSALDMIKNLEDLEKSAGEVYGVGPKTAERAGDLRKRMAAEQAIIDSTDPSVTQKQKNEAIKEQNRLMQEAHKIINDVVDSEIRGIGKKIEGGDKLLEQHKQINEEYKKANEELDKTVNKMDDLALKTTNYTESKKNLKAAGVEIADEDLMDPEKLQKKIDKLNPKETEKREAFEAHLKAVNELKAQGITTEQQLIDKNKELQDQSKKQEQILNNTRNKKTQLLSTILDQAVAEGKITKETGETLKQSAKLLDNEEKLTKEKKKRKSMQKSIRANKGVEVPDVDPKPKKDGFLQKITSATLYFAALRALRKMITSVIATVRELDKSITEVAMVTNMNRAQTWKLVGAYQALAQEVGTTTSEIARLSVFFFRQGRTAKDAMELTKVAATAAKVASIDAVKSANFLTSAINGFGLAADQAMAVSDRFAALGASSASSYEEMAIALSKVAPVAKVAGVGIDFMMGVLAKGIETTREAPENIGTAFKTIFARMTQIRDFGATLEDGMGVNKVEEALKQAGVALRDSSGNFRDMDLVLTELGKNFEGLTRNQQSYIATALAGTRQQSRLLAVMQNFDRTLELVNVSLNASGATLAQHEIFASGLEASMARLRNSFQAITLALSESEFIIEFVDRLAKVLGEVAENIENNEKAIKIFASVGAVILIAALIAIKVAALAAAKALTFATFGLNILLPVILAIAGVGLHKWLQASQTESQKLAKASKEVSKELKQVQVSMYNLQRSRTSITGLINRFKELDSQVIKSAEELAEMDDIAEKLQEQLEGTDYEITLTGKIDEDAKTILGLIDKELKEQQERELELGLDKLRDYAMGTVKSLDGSDKQAASKALSEIMFGNEFLKATLEEQIQMQEIASNNFEEYVQIYRDTIIAKEKLDKQYIESMIGINKAEARYASATEPTFGQLAWNQVKNVVRGVGRLLGGKHQKVTSDDLREEAREMATQINEDNLTTLRTTGENGGLRNLFASNQEMIEAAAEAQGVTIDEIYTKNMDFVIEGIRKHAATVQQAFEEEVNRINENTPDTLNTAIIGMREGFVKFFKDGIDPEEQKTLLEKFFGLDEASQRALANSVDDLGFVYQLGIENLKEVIGKTMTDAGDGLVTAAQKINIVKILQGAGLSKNDITSFFAETSEFTAASIRNFLDSIVSAFDGVEDVDFQNLVGQLFDLFTGGMDPQKLYNQVQQAKSAASTIMDLQEKFRNNMLTSEEYLMVSERLSGTGMMEQFMNGTLTAVEFMEKSVDILTDSIDKTIEGIEGKLKSAVNPGEITAFQEQLLLLNHMRDNIEELVFTQSMDDYYQSQIDYIQQINKELQEEIDLEQKKIDMNRSMLSLNRQIMALERDTSYGARARREDLELTRDKQVAEQNKFIIETISNQAISQLQNLMQQRTATATEQTAANTLGILTYLTTGNTSARTFQTYSGIGMKHDNKIMVAPPEG